MLCPKELAQVKGIEFLQHYPQHIIDTLTWRWPWPLLFLLGLMAVFYTVIGVVRLINHYRLIGADFVFLELKPAAFSDSSPFATEKFFSVLHNMDSTRTTVDKLFGRKIIIPLEVASTKATGIRYIAVIRKGKETLFRRSLEGYLPDTRLTKVKDYLPQVILKQGQHVMSLSFRLYRHFCYPLLVSNELSKHDPASYITNTMTQLADNELVSFQLVVTPVKPKEATKIHNKLIRGEEPQLNKRAWLWLLPLKLVFLLIKLGMGALRLVLETIGDATRPSYPTGKYYPPPAQPRPPILTPEAQSIDDIRNQKLSEPLFQVSIRALIVADSKKEAKERASGIIAAMGSYRRPGFQALVSRSSFPTKLRLPYRLFHYTHRLPTLTQGGSCILSSSELAALYHFPHSVSAKTENVVKSLSKALPAPISMKGKAKLDVVLGANNYHNAITPIGLTADQRERHTYIIGGTGNGKTTLLEFAIIQDMQSGKGLAIIDPHGDAAEKLLGFVPKDRIKDVVYLNPADISYPIGINLLELPESLSENDDYIMEKERVTEAVVSILRKVFADDEANAHRIESMLRNTIRTAFYADDPTLFTILKLIRNQTFRNSIIAKLDDDDLKDFWREEFGKAGGMQRVSMSKGLTSRLDRFRASAPVYRMFSQTKSTISFEDIMNQGKILICNFSSDMGEDTSTLFGTTVLAKLKIAAERRKSIPPNKRRPFHVYVDEFQNFATTPFTKMLSTARKYKLFLTIAEQSTTQQEEQRMVETILANVGNTITFRSGSPVDEKLMLARFRPQVEEGDIANLPAYNFYMKIMGVETQEPFSAQTLLLENEGSSNIAEQVVKSSRMRYASIYKEVRQPKHLRESVENKVDNPNDEPEPLVV